jgi:hypothetical protein
LKKFDIADRLSKETYFDGQGDAVAKKSLRDCEGRRSMASKAIEALSEPLELSVRIPTRKKKVSAS